MLGRFTFVRLKAAENAYKDDRIDEAFQIVRAADLRDHRRGQKLLSKLGVSFLERARSHMTHSAFGEALLDLDRAEEAGSAKDAIASLRKEVREQADQAQLKNRHRRERLNTAKQRLGAGSVRGARDVLANASDGDGEAHHLLGHADRRLEQAAAVAEEARQHFKAGRLEAAIERCIRAKALDGRCEALATLEAEIVETMLKRIHTALVDGRLDLADQCLKHLRPLSESSPDRHEADQILSLARNAARAVYRYDFPSAREMLRRLQYLAPKVGWIKEAIENLTHAEDALAAVRGGPLGLAVEAPVCVDPDSPTILLEHPKSVERSVKTKPIREPDNGALPEQLLLLVDGAASFLLLRNSRISIGRMASDDPADVTLVSDLSQRHADIARIEDDYFFTSSNEVTINGRAVREKLLADGDKIRLNSHTRLRFRLPSRRSSSAVLELGDHVRTIGDVRQIVLLNRHASLGSSSSCHMRVPMASQHLLVYERGGALWVRPQTGGSIEDAVLLPLGTSVEIAGLRLVLDRATPAKSSLV